MGDDDWLRLMDIQNTKLYGGFAAKKLETESLTVLKEATLGRLVISAKYALRAGDVDSLRLEKAEEKDKLANLELNKLTANAFKTGYADFTDLTAHGTIRGKYINVVTQLGIGEWKFGADNDPTGNENNNWLKMTYGNGGKARFAVDFIKTSEIHASKLQISATASVEDLHAKKATIKGLKVDGRIDVTEGIWLTNKNGLKQRITPHNDLMEEVQALREELASMKAEMAEMRESRR